MARFTISHHVNAPEGDHYDLMLEDGKTQRTWRIPHTNFETEQQATALPNHRLDYLDRE